MEDWARRIREGDTRALARAATAVENGDPSAAALLREVSAHGGGATIFGITGPPGAGKSSLVDAIARALRSEGRTVGIIAVDPSSRTTGGAILGDRIRMIAHHADPGIFIRSMATRGSMGGLARATRDLAALLDAAGRDFVIIETVGVGQGEVEIAGLAQVTAVVLVPGMGDDIQAIKAGIMEIADVFVVNKADLPGADRVEREVQAMLGLAQRADGWTPPIVRTIATEGSGVADLLAAVRSYQAWGAQTNKLTFRHPEPGAGEFGAAARSMQAALRFYEQRLGMRVSARIGQSGASVALQVPDLPHAVQRLREAGARVSNEPEEGSARVLAASGGVVLELIQQEELPH
jgi:LAO/AO transport system kinase